MYSSANRAGLGIMALCDIQDESNDASMVYDDSAGCWVSLDDTGAGGVASSPTLDATALTPTLSQTQQAVATTLPAPVIIGASPVPVVVLPGSVASTGIPPLVIALGAGLALWWYSRRGR